MQTKRLWGVAGLALVVALFVAVPLMNGKVFAQGSSSNNYQMVESGFGNTTSNESCSTEYCASVSIGNDSASSAVVPEFGEAEYSEPLLEVIVVPGESNLGQLTTEHTGSKTMQVKIRNYLTGGYRLMLVGDPPRYGARKLNTPTTPTDSRAGTEQFGVNVVANTQPAVGVNPVLQGGGDGTPLVTANYSTANKFMYVPGQVLAETQTNSGGAEYTISMIVNISNATPAGKYSGDFAAVVVPNF